LKVAPASADALAARNSLLSALPQSDGVMFVDVKRILNDALPAVLAHDPKLLAQAQAQLDKFKQQTTLDPRSWENMAVSMRFTPNSGGFDIKSLGFIKGSFNAGALIAAGRFAAAGKYKQEEYKGKQLYLFDMGAALKDVPVIGALFKEVAITELNANTLVLGDLAAVKATLDAAGDGPRVSGELVALATRNPNSLMGLAVNVPPGAVNGFGLDAQNDEIGKTLAAIRHAGLSLGLQESGAELNVAARTEKDADAKNLADTLNALKQFAGLAMGNLKPDQQKLAENALETLKVVNEGNETRLLLEINRNDFPALLGLIK
jgi:hypothetical protein